MLQEFYKAKNYFRIARDKKFDFFLIFSLNLKILHSIKSSSYKNGKYSSKDKRRGINFRSNIIFDFYRKK